MRRSSAFKIGATYALALIALTASKAVAADRYAVIAVENTTNNANVGMSYRWGDANWERATLNPGHIRHFCYRFPHPNEDRNPPFHIKFDSDVTPGKYTEAYHLMAHRAPDCDARFAHRYNFRYEVQRKFVELYDPEKH